MKKILCLAVACALSMGTVSFAASGSKEADYLVEKGYLFGTEKGLELDRNATNAEALTMLYRVAGKTVPAARNVSHWAEPIIKDAMDNGYIGGSEDNLALSGTLKTDEDRLILESAGGETYALNTDSTVAFVGDKTGVALSEVIDELTGKEVMAIVSPAMTRSLPPQTNAYYILAESEGHMPIYFEVGEVTKEGAFVNAMSADGNYRFSVNNTFDANPFLTKNIVKADELRVGDKILVYSDIMTLSIPAHLQPSKITLLKQAEIFEPDEEIDAADFIEIAEKILPGSEISDETVTDGQLSRADMIKYCYTVLNK